MFESLKLYFKTNPSLKNNGNSEIFITEQFLK